MDLLSNIKASEGCRLTSYKDSVGVCTIGYGHTPASDNQVCTQEQADAWLGKDVSTAKQVAVKLPEWPALDTQARQDAVVELIFNIGPSRWSKFVQTRAAIADGHWQDAHDGLLDSKWATQVGPSRSTRLAKQLLDGTYGD